ncbi:tetratricopeptide repeat protein [Amycolatopsis sp. FBCC-B4732]|uniref:tetratricopeptide repeat protein n=1 Tax=Amycolatopsis sp. FBCC-B4732 TaxID=3079339 RepID=UPI001FF600AA|nr:tetratricopeptide repeat protein [Amycolatopsis sp. FBCC-B4732]UOX91928.1 tetratricopeptide repeat protein [Amycolatopsis sp. FBCC-B4732]
MSDPFVNAELALRQFDGAAALAAFETMPANGGDRDARALAGRVRALWLLRRWNEARAALAELSAWRGSVHVELARGIIALGQPDDPAYQTFNCGAALRDADRALAAFRSACRLDPTNGEALAGQATALRLSERIDEAVRLLADAAPPVRTSSAVLVERALCAGECDDYAAAVQLLNSVPEREPGSLHAELVRIELWRRSARGSAEVSAAAAHLRLRFSRYAAVLEIHAATLADQALVTRESEINDAAAALYGEALSIDPFRPGAVAGVIVVMRRRGESADAANRLVEMALDRNPLSPQLNSCRAKILVGSGAAPQRIVDAYQHVLEIDPRMFQVSLRLAQAQIDLGRNAAAHETIAAISRQYPHHPDAFQASSWLQDRWRMPETSAIETRIDRPWEEERDAPDHVLDYLLGEVVRRRQLPPRVANRLRDRVRLDGDVLLEREFAYEQHYLRARNEYLTRMNRSANGALWGSCGQIIRGLSIAVVIFAMPFLVWLITDLIGLSGGWRWGLVVGIPALWAAFAFLDDVYYLEIEIFGLDSFELVSVVSGLSVPAAAVWQGVVWYGAGAGLVVGGLAAGTVAAMYRFGQFLVDRHSKPAPVFAQAAYDEWLERLYGSGLLPLAAEASGGLDSPYSILLPSHSKIVSEAVVDIDTDATRELRQLLGQRGKGSFALAGPRGAGKSTLLERWCAGRLLRGSDDRKQETRRDLTVRVDAPLGYQSKDFLTHLFGRLCDEVEKYATEHDRVINDLVSGGADGSSHSLLVGAFRLLRGVQPERGRRPGPGSIMAAELARFARDEREKLRVLQSRTTEGELSVGAPPVVGATFGFKRKTSVKRDDVPLNHPQLVDRFRVFLGVAAAVARKLEGKVLIGIDELDRISDGERAQLFLNELKAVFNVPNCYFLVSVSEDALADFELTAMGMRTVLDSAFDAVVRVDYLTFEQAKQLLNRRVVDLPEQFSALAYVVSGGLARELVRISEAISDHKSSDKLDLAAVTARLVRRQLDRTTRAAMDRLSRSPDRQAGATLIPVLDEHPVDALTGKLLREFAKSVSEAGARGDAEPELVAGIRLDVSVMAEYLAVLLDIFDNRLDEQWMSVGTGPGPGGFETLARARRYLGANPYGAKELVSAIHKVWGTTKSLKG